MRTLHILLTAAVLCAAPACGGDASTPELCDEACRVWDACTGQAGWYPYATCMTDCRAEGDWDQGYVDCVKRYTSCEDLERECG